MTYLVWYEHKLFEGATMSIILDQMESEEKAREFFRNNFPSFYITEIEELNNED